MILVVDNYDSFTWNLVHYLEQAGARTKVIRNDEHTTAEALALRPAGIVLSPGPCTPREAGICVDLVRTAPEDLPILGVCLGHQSIGDAMGEPVIHARAILHGKVSRITNNQAGLFTGLPEHYDVVRYHSLAIPADRLPDTLLADAWTEDGEIMAVHHKTRPLYGVQFHPESIRTEYGHELIENFLKLT
ncbi:aminodeoxychorismate/anthranilate synthase component II [Henriciella sp.]|uniref:anthranilate synthase component II n=1 Tax=Henriciella sp. TaxID=1968823 RepID=UPI002627DA5D|nr:aminodeoxychorismate/anthranilate synthase component II [Henriciella sp.]